MLILVSFSNLYRTVRFCRRPVPSISGISGNIFSTKALGSSAVAIDGEAGMGGTSKTVELPPDAISHDHPLRVMIAGAGVGGLVLANDLAKKARTENIPLVVTVLEQTAEFKRFGGPIQLASNALQILKEMDAELYAKIMDKFTVTGDKVNGIKDGIRTEWYAKFDLKSPAQNRNMPYTGVIDRPDLQEIQLAALPKGTVHNGDGVARYEVVKDVVDGRERSVVKAVLSSGKEFYGDVLIGADGIWSAVRATMRGTPRKGDGSGATYSGYTLFAGELEYASKDNGEVGYKVYIGPNQVNTKQCSLLVIINHHSQQCLR